MIIKIKKNETIFKYETKLKYDIIEHEILKYKNTI